MFSKISKDETNTDNLKFESSVVIESSICTGEKLIGFKNDRTGKLEKAVIVQSQKDIDDFYRKYSLKQHNN